MTYWYVTNICSSIMIIASAIVFVVFVGLFVYCAIRLVLEDLND